MNFDAKSIRPSWLYCLWIIPVAGIGFGLFAYLQWTGIQQATGSLTQIVVPGEKDVAFATPGLYTSNKPSLLGDTTVHFKPLTPLDAE